MEKLELLNGNFSAEEAKEILLAIFSSKIHFHEMKNLSSVEQTGKTDEFSRKRITALKIEVDKIKKITSDAASKNKKVFLFADVSVQV